MIIPSNLEAQFHQYAKLIVERGVAVEPDQLVVITCSTSTIYFAPYITKAAYLAGAGYVHIQLEDDRLNHLRDQYANEWLLEMQLHAISNRQKSYKDQGACFIRFVAPDLTVKNELPLHRTVLLSNIRQSLQKPSLAAQFAFEVRRQASPVATVEWAEQIFPHLKGQEAFLQLWEMILTITHSDSVDAVESWDKHIAGLLEQKAVLNELEIQSLHFKNSLGTNITIELADHNQWFGGNCYDIHGHEFHPSIPTEEIFAAPHRYKVNGTVYNSVPLYEQNECIDDFHLVFRDGKVVSYRAGVGEEVLTSILNTDEGAKYLGEVALVHHQSPLAKSNLLFFETLCDENRASHLALGAGYPGCIVGEDRTTEFMEQCGLNQSSIHIDFMFGTDDMIVTATLKNGNQVVIMEQGNFVV